MSGRQVLKWRLLHLAYKIASRLEVSEHIAWFFIIDFFCIYISRCVKKEYFIYLIFISYNIFCKFLHSKLLLMIKNRLLDWAFSQDVEAGIVSLLFRSDIRGKIVDFFGEGHKYRIKSNVKASGPIQFLSSVILCLESLAGSIRFIVLHHNFRYPRIPRYLSAIFFFAVYSPSFSGNIFCC